jgi:hypothetical protein
MECHRNEVKDLLWVLGKMAKGSDDDGPDLYFTGNMRRIHSTSISELVDVLSKAKYVGQPDITTALQRIFEEKVYKAYVKKPVSIYVFTNGDWECFDDQLLERIQTLVAHLDGCNKPLETNHVGIQLIRFGNSERGKSRLKYLDDKISGRVRR